MGFINGYTTIKAGWPSGLRRQTQELLKGVFWYTNVCVGSNPTPVRVVFATIALKTADKDILLYTPALSGHLTFTPPQAHVLNIYIETEDLFRLCLPPVRYAPSVTEHVSLHSK